MNGQKPFSTNMVYTDIYHCLPGLRKFAARKHPGIPLENLIIKGDYSSGLSPIFDIVAPKNPATVNSTVTTIVVDFKYGSHTISSPLSIRLQADHASFFVISEDFLIDRGKLGISRVQKIAADTHLPLEVVGWDRVDDIWFRAQEMGNIWDNIEKAVAGYGMGKDHIYTERLMELAGVR